MKKLSARSVLMVILVGASFCSYVFLHFASINASASLPPVGVEQSVEQLKQGESEELLPDVTLFKRAFSLGRHLIPGL